MLTIIQSYLKGLLRQYHIQQPEADIEALAQHLRASYLNHENDSCSDEDELEKVLLSEEERTEKKLRQDMEHYTLSKEQLAFLFSKRGKELCGAVSFRLSEISTVDVEEAARLQEDHLLRTRPSPFIHWAAYNGMVKTVQALLQKGVSPNTTRSDGVTPLHCAAQGGHEVVAKILIEAGARVDSISNNQQTPLHSAALMGRKEVASLLLEKGANPNACTNQGLTALSVAVDFKQAAMIPLLKEYGSDVNAAYATDPNLFNGTLLHRAVSQGDVATATALLEAGANPNACNNQGFTPLSVAVGYEQAAMIPLLKQYGGNVNAAFATGPNLFNGPLLQKAVAQGNLTTATALLEAGANPNACHKQGLSALSVAVSCKRAAMIPLLKQYGGNVNAAYATDPNLFNGTLLHRAVSQGDVATATALLDAGADVHARMFSGFTAMHLAAFYEMSKIIPLLQARGGDVNAVVGEEGAIYLPFGERLSRAASVLEDIEDSRIIEAVALKLQLGEDISTKGQFMEALEAKDRALNGLALNIEWKGPKAIIMQLLQSVIPPEPKGIPRQDHFRAFFQEIGKVLPPLEQRSRINPEILYGNQEYDPFWKKVHTYISILCNIQHKTCKAIIAKHLGLTVEQMNEEQVLTAFQQKFNAVKCIWDWGSEYSIEKMESLLDSITSAIRDDLPPALRYSPITDPLTIYYSQGDLPLHIAASGKEATTVAALLEAGAAVNTVDLEGDTPLQLATRLGNSEMASLLIKAGACINRANNDKKSILQEAISRSDLSLVSLLIDNGADPNGVSGQEEAPLNTAACLATANDDSEKTSPSITIMHRLLIAGAKIGDLPYRMVLRSQKEALECLLNWGIDIRTRYEDIENDFRKGYRPTLLDVVIEKRNKELAQLLMEYGFPCDLEQEGELEDLNSFETHVYICAGIFEDIFNAKYTTESPLCAKLKTFLLQNSSQLSRYDFGSLTSFQSFIRDFINSHKETLMQLGTDDIVKSLVKYIFGDSNNPDHPLTMYNRRNPFKIIITPFTIADKLFSFSKDSLYELYIYRKEYTKETRDIAIKRLHNCCRYYGIPKDYKARLEALFEHESEELTACYSEEQIVDMKKQMTSLFDSLRTDKATFLEKAQLPLAGLLHLIDPKTFPSEMPYSLLCNVFEAAQGTEKAALEAQKKAYEAMDSWIGYLLEHREEVIIYFAQNPEMAMHMIHAVSHQMVLDQEHKEAWEEVVAEYVALTPLVRQVLCKQAEQIAGLEKSSTSHKRPAEAPAEGEAKKSRTFTERFPATGVVAQRRMSL